MSDNWKSCWNCWRKRRKNRPHQNRYCKAMKTSKIMLMPFFFQCCWNKGKMSLSFTRSAASSMGQNQWKRYVFRNHLLLDPTVMTRYAFPCMAPVSCFPALGDGVMFCPVWHLVMFSRAWDRLHVGLVSDWLIAYVAFLICHMATWVNFLLFVLIYKWD